MTRKERVHALVERLPEGQLATAESYLAYLCAVSEDPVLRAVLTAPPDDEPLTEADRIALQDAQSEVAAGKLYAHEEVRRRVFGFS